MSLFSWFKRTPQALHGHEAVGQVAATGATRHGSSSAKNPSGQASETTADTTLRRKNERARLRDLLYNVVRETMVRVGVLSSSFKFKVLATDPKGRKFIVMMDLSRNFGSEISQLAEIETMICQTAKARYNIVVSSVYWRAEDPATASTPDNTSPTAQYRADIPTLPVETPAAKAPGAVPQKPEPVLAEEIRALKRALASGTAPAHSSSDAAKKYTSLTGYENTEITESELPENEAAETEILGDEDQYPALSGTQYGELR